MKTFLHILFFLCWLFLAKSASGQIVLSGGYINITGGGFVVVDNPAATAITRNSGYIISEGENNILKWNTGTNIGAYTVPFGYSADYIPLSFTKSAGTGNGYMSFSTYRTGWQNSASLPASVLNVNHNGVDQSPYVIDRFWSIDAAGYTVKPNLADLTFTYRDAEHTASGNSIVENELGIQRWNPSISDWVDFIPGVTINTTSNTISVATVNAGDLYKWWTLPSISFHHTLPVELTLFKGECNDGVKTISWITASELNSASFALESSTDAVNWNLVRSLPAAGNSNRTLSYSVTDEGEGNYYRLTQLDIGGRSNIYDIIHVSCAQRQIAQFEIFPNPSSGQFYMRNIPENSTIEVFDPLGQIVHTENTDLAESGVNLSGFSKGMYVVVLRSGQKTITNKLMIQ